MADVFRCSFCGEAFVEDDNNEGMLRGARDVGFCNKAAHLCVVKAHKQVIAHKSAEREYLSWGRNETKA